MISFRIYVLLTMLILKSLLVNEGSFILVVIEFFPHENSRQKLRLNILVVNDFFPHEWSGHKVS